MTGALLHILCLSDETRGTSQTFAIIPGHAIETVSLLEAVDLCFKASFCFWCSVHQAVSPHLGVSPACCISNWRKKVLLCKVFEDNSGLRLTWYVDDFKMYFVAVLKSTHLNKLNCNRMRVQISCLMTFNAWIFGQIYICYKVCGEGWMSEGVWVGVGMGG